MKTTISTLAFVALVSFGASAMGGELRAKGRAGYRYVPADKKATTIAVYVGERDTQIHRQAHRADNNRSRLLVPQGRSGYVRADRQSH